jgi:hypothetical protein
MKIKSVRAVHKIEFTPDEYEAYCGVIGEEPTQEGFLKFVAKEMEYMEEFLDDSQCGYELEVIEEDENED